MGVDWFQSLLIVMIAARLGAYCLPLDATDYFTASYTPSYDILDEIPSATYSYAQVPLYSVESPIAEAELPYYSQSFIEPFGELSEEDLHHEPSYYTKLPFSFQYGKDVVAYVNRVYSFSPKFQYAFD